MDTKTDLLRAKLAQAINEEQSDKQTLAEREGVDLDSIFDTKELQERFSVEGFGAPLVVVCRKSDNKRGTLWFQHSPRLYWGFQEE